MAHKWYKICTNFHEDMSDDSDVYMAFTHRDDDGFIILHLLHVIKSRLGIKEIMLWNKHQI